MKMFFFILTVFCWWLASAQFDEYGFDPYAYDPYGGGFNPYQGGYDPYGYGGDVPPPFEEIQTLEELTELTKEKAVTVAFFRIPEEGDDPDYSPPVFEAIEPFVEVAKSLSNRGYHFAVSVEEALLDNFKVSEWKIYTFLPSDFLSGEEKAKKRFSGDKVTEHSLVHFIASNSFPISGVSTAETEFSLYHQESVIQRPICAIFSRSDDAWKTYILKRIAKAAVERNEVIFTLFDKDVAGKLHIFNGRHLGIQPEEAAKSDYIGVYCRSIKTASYYKLSVSFSAATLLEIAKHVSAASTTSTKVVEILDIEFVEPEYVGNEHELPPSEEEDPNILVLTGGGLEELVDNLETDVLIEFYAPWCGHCQRFASEYSLVAEELLSKEIIVAKIDADEERFPAIFDVTHFPTLYYLKKEFSDKPILYTGSLEASEVLKFAEEAKGVISKDEL